MLCTLTFALVPSPPHAPTHAFIHVRSAYYVYLWAEVLDADAFGAFEEAGDIFHPATAKLLRECIYSRGNSADPAELYRQFRGRDPTIEPMLLKRGLVGK